MRHIFGINSNIFETNILNLAVVLGIVVTVVGEAVRELLEERRKTILLALEEADQKAAAAQQRLRDAQKSVETARVRAEQIRLQATQTIEQENLSIQKQLERDLKRLRERGAETINLEYQRAVQAIARQVTTLALTAAESTLLTSFGSQDPTRSKQKKLNELHIRKTLSQLKKASAT
jgi:F-type H+-transporting ATPase subunit b